MKLEAPTIEYITQAVTTAQLLGMESICIESTIIRAMLEDRSVFLLHTDNIPELPFEAVGITRLPQFLSRIKLVEDKDKFTIDSTIINDEVKSLMMKCTGTKIDFKCASPAKVAAPRKFKDQPAFSMTMDQGTIDILKQSENAMKTDTLTIISNNELVCIEMNDVNNDVFRHQIDSEVTSLNEESILFAHRYPSKLLISLLRHTGETPIEICSQGSLKININGFDIFVLPKV